MAVRVKQDLENIDYIRNRIKISYRGPRETHQSFKCSPHMAINISPNVALLQQVGDQRNVGHRSRDAAEGLRLGFSARRRRQRRLAGTEAVRLTLHWLDGRDEPSPLLESVYAHFDNDLMRLVIWANEANATQFAQIAPLVIEHVKRKTPLAVTLIRQAAGEIDRLGPALGAQSLNKNLPCSPLGGLAQFIEPLLGDSLRSRLVPCESDSVSGALLMIRKAVRDQPLAETGCR